MKKIIITLSVIVGCLLADPPNAVGYWKLSGLKVDYLHITRAEFKVIANDAYDFGVEVELKTVPSGILYNQFTNGPFTLADIDEDNLNLNVNLFGDGTGSIADGSFYPDIDLIEGTCITSPQIFPVTDDFAWETGPELLFEDTNILGTAGVNDHANTQAWGFGVSQSGTFDGFPSTPAAEPLPHVLDYLATPDGTILAAGCGLACTSPTVDSDGDEVPDMSAADALFQGSVETCVAACGNPAGYGLPADAFGYAGWLQGTSSGFFNVDMGQSQMTDESGAFQDLNVDFLLEWNSIDGAESGSGFGDDPDVDEDGDGSEYDRIFGIPYLESTQVLNDPACDLSGGSGFDKPLVGDIVGTLGGEAAVAAFLTGQCLDQVQGQCDEAGSPQNLAYGGCLQATLAGVIGQCGQAGGPGNFATGLCADAAGSDDLQAVCNADVALGGGWENAVIGLCMGLDVDAATCAAAAAGADAIFENYCLTELGADCDTVSAMQGSTIECTLLDNETFAAGACGAVVGGLVTETDCSVWGASLTTSFLDSAAEAAAGASCTNIGLSQAAYTCDMDAWADGFATNVLGETCTQYGATFTTDCQVELVNVNDFYIMDLSLGNWGMFLTYNAASFQQTAAALQANAPGTVPADAVLDLDQDGTVSADEAAYYIQQDGTIYNASAGGYVPTGWTLENDAADVFNPACYQDSSIECSGKIHMTFEPTCVPELEARQIVAEFVNLDDLCESSGDVDGNGNTNVADVVLTINHILGCEEEDLYNENCASALNGTERCQADRNGDGTVNVVDVVLTVNQILGNSFHGDTNEANVKASIKYTNNDIDVTSDGFVQGVQFTISHCENFDIDLVDAHFAEYSTSNNTTTVVVVGNGDESLTEIAKVSSSCDIAVSNVVISGREKEIVSSTEQVQIKGYSVNPAYPNPFNPTTNISLTLDYAADVSVKIYNIAGQLVDVIAEGSFNPSSYKWTWNAENLASGVYFVSTQVGSDIHTEKIMLLK